MCILACIGIMWSNPTRIEPLVSVGHDIDDQLTHIGHSIVLTHTATQRQEMNQVDLTEFILVLLISHNPTETPEQHKPSGCNSVHWYLYTLCNYIKALCQGKKTDLVDFTIHYKFSIRLSGLNNTSVTGTQCTAKQNRFCKV